LLKRSLILLISSSTSPNIQPIFNKYGTNKRFRAKRHITLYRMQKNALAAAKVIGIP